MSISKVIHLDVNSDISSQPFTMWFCRHHWMVLRPLPCKFCKVCANTLKVINEISVKFAWVFQYIYSFRRQFRRQFLNRFSCNFAGTIGWNYGNCPANLAEFDWVLQKLLMQSTEPTLWQRRRSVFLLISQLILNRFTCNFAHTIRSHCSDCPENLVRIDRVFQKLLMWCTETTLFPRRQSAENAAVIETALRKCPPPIVHVWLSS